MLDLENIETICHLNSTHLDVLLSGINSQNESLCEHCIDADELSIMKEKNAIEFWYIFDTGKCDKCGQINDIVYVPLWKLFLTKIEDSNDFIKWCYKFPRLKKDIAKNILVGNIQLDILDIETLNKLEKISPNL